MIIDSEEAKAAERRGWILAGLGVCLVVAAVLVAWLVFGVTLELELVEPVPQ